MSGNLALHGSRVKHFELSLERCGCDIVLDWETNLNSLIELELNKR